MYNHWFLYHCILHVIVFAVYVARRAFVIVTLLYVVLNVHLAQETIKAYEFEFVMNGWCMGDAPGVMHEWCDVLGAWMNEWMKMNEWMDEWMNEWVCTLEWLCAFFLTVVIYLYLQYVFVSF